MRIFQVLSATANASVPVNRTWYLNLHEPLVEMGHDVVLFSAQEGRRAMARKDATVRATFSQKLVDTFASEHTKKPFDLFFAYLKDGMVDTGAIDQIRKSGVPTCNFSCNNTHQFHVVDGISPHFDFNLHSERDVRHKFLAVGANPLWWPMASNPKYFKPHNVPRTIDVSFVGANYALRARYVFHLLENGVDVHACGPRWQRLARTRWRAMARRGLYLCQVLLAASRDAQARAAALLADYDFRRHLSARFPDNVHAPVSDEELITLYSRSHISLGFLEVYDQHDPSRIVTRHLHLREFEAPMSGALYCTGYMDELAEFFEPDREVLVYRNQHELLDKVRYYLAHPMAAERIRQAGHARALRDHTYHQRFQRLFREIRLPG
ncbi:MAG: glycosyltransferase [Anaerolineae bacterium]|jgi:spore maturation protein CgeB